jgi:D-tyrosyl-tRNA(Tyr) deacylase
LIGKDFEKVTAVLQRVKRAAVSVDGTVRGSCKHGFFILLGVFEGDTKEDARLLAEKIAKLQVFEDENGKMNRSINDVAGSALVIPQFTLCANYEHGNRPDFLAAAKPAEANELYEYFSQLLRTLVNEGVENGVFGADMSIEALCDGPVTIVMESEKLKKKKG